MNRKAQTVPLSTIIVVMILVVLVFTSYIWGRGLLFSYRDRASVSYAEGRLLDVKRAVLEVVREGQESTRSIRFDASSGLLYVSKGESCSGGLPLSNGVFFNISSEKTKFLEASSENTWVSIDPSENSTACSANYTTHSSGVLIGKYYYSSGYQTTFGAWFRNLTDDTGRIYSINLSISGNGSGLSSGVQSLSIKNAGVTRTATATVSNINLDIL